MKEIDSENSNQADAKFPKFPPTAAERHTQRLQEWRESNDRIAARIANGEAVTAACAHEGIYDSVFYARRKKLADAGIDVSNSYKVGPYKRNGKTKVHIDPEVIFNMFDTGWGTGQIRKHFGVGPSVVEKWRYKWQLLQREGKTDDSPPLQIRIPASLKANSEPVHTGPTARSKTPFIFILGENDEVQRALDSLAALFTKE